MEEKKERMRELAKLLTRASKAYYQEDREIISNLEYDRLYDELLALERETGIVLSKSPTQNVGYEAVKELPKERHEQPMLSLDKTKDVDALCAFAGNQSVLISWKLDGLTIVLTYRDGKLQKAVTRGNGEIGEVVTNNARVFQNLPLTVPYSGELVLRGEAVISYRDFERINEEIADADAKYKNPRNLCSGSVRQLNNEITAGRSVQFYAFALVRAEGVDFKNSRQKQFEWMERQGFSVVEYRLVAAGDVKETVEWFRSRVGENPIPSDGLVAVYDDIAYGQSLGRTAKFPRDSFAFKWEDELRETRLLEIEWSPSRTGLINPVAVFEPVELEGTTVSRASVHNLSILKGLKLGIGDVVRVYKANMIIPQIAENLTGSGNLKIPAVCPVCGGETEVRRSNDVETLYCTNPKCQAKRIKAFSLFASRDAINIEGMSEATLEKFIGRGFIHEFSDIFKLDEHKDEIVEMEGFGEKSYGKLRESIEKARDTTLPRLLYSLGIPGIGAANAKVICRAFQYDLKRIQEADVSDLASVDGIGEVLGKAVADYFCDRKNQEQLERLVKELEIQKPEMEKTELTLEGQTFVITGSLERFANRNELKALIEERGGKVTGSVTKKTSYLINNDTTSSSSKNKKAKELGISIISEEDFCAMVEENAR